MRKQFWETGEPQLAAAESFGRVTRQHPVPGAPVKGLTGDAVARTGRYEHLLSTNLYPVARAHRVSQLARFLTRALAVISRGRSFQSRIVNHWRTQQ